MAEFHWTVLGKTGNKYEVGLFHSDKTGHLLVHCNSKPILIDFFIKDTSEYSFFLDDELFELTIEKKEGIFLYGLKSNTTADTPLNRAVKHRDKSDLIKTALVFAGFLALLAGFVFGIPYYQNKRMEAKKEVLLAQGGVAAELQVKRKDGAELLSYFFVADGATISGSVDPNLSERGFRSFFPIENDDVFFVRYLRDNPQIHVIFWNKPSSNQVEKYKIRCRKVHQRKHLDFSKEKVACEINLAFELDSLRGLAEFYFQSANKVESPNFNKNTYEKYIRSEPFRSKTKERCWY